MKNSQHFDSEFGPAAYVEKHIYMDYYHWCLWSQLVLVNLESMNDSVLFRRGDQTNHFHLLDQKTAEEMKEKPEPILLSSLDSGQ